MEKVKPNAEEQLHMSSQIIQLELQNARLAEQLKEVMKMNTHWQRYDSQREEYVLKLTKTNQELQDKVSDLHHQIEDLGIFKVLTTEKKVDSKTEPQPSSYKRDEATCAEQAELDALRKEEEVAALTDSIAKLKDRIVELEIGRESRTKEDDDQLAMLREQVKVCVEDFNQERKDRERIHADNLKLRKSLALAENQIRVYGDRLAQFQKLNQTVSRPPPRGGYDVPCCYPEDRPHRAQFAPYYERHPGGHRPQNTRYRHPVYFGDDLTDLPRDVEIDGEILDDTPIGTDEADDLPISLIDDNPSQKTVRTNGTHNDEEACDVPPECPRCLASFESDSDLLHHIDKCMD